MKINKDMLKFLVQEQINEQFPGFEPPSKVEDVEAGSATALLEIRDLLKEVRDMMQTLINKADARASRPEMMK